MKAASGPSKPRCDSDSCVADFNEMAQIARVDSQLTKHPSFNAHNPRYLVAVRGRTQKAKNECRKERTTIKSLGHTFLTRMVEVDGDSGGAERLIGRLLLN